MDLPTVLGYTGPAFAVGLSCIGSAIGCGIASMASHGAMESEKTDPGVHGKLVALSAFPSSQAVYGIVLMFVLINKISGGLATLSLGLMGGVAIMASAIYQGRACATGIKASARNPEVFGKCCAGPGVIEGFALFAMVGCCVGAIMIVGAMQGQP
ncbi:ATP synthase subunit C [Planctomycetota bacterium]